MSRFQLTSFCADVTPPIGHPLCAGMVQPARGVSEPLLAQGVILLEKEHPPLVLCAVDWCEIRNADHVFWREQIALAVGTSPDRVVVQCVHQHNAPIVDTALHYLVSEADTSLSVMEVEWCAAAAKQVAQAASQSLSSASPVTHIATGQAEVQGIASNRRVMNSAGKVGQVRWSACPDPALRAEPEGTIDPTLTTISLWNEDTKLVSLHHYATHPMSYYGDGIVSSDFVGIARARCVQREGTPHLYFTGCAGDITPGKYNDGTPESRVQLAERLYEAMSQAEEGAERRPLEQIQWRTQEVFLPENQTRSAESLRTLLRDSQRSAGERIGAALEIAFKEYRKTTPAISLSCLSLGEKVRLLYLPGEPFIDYQLTARRQSPDLLIAVCGYGDGGPGYLPLASSYEEGGYEPTGAFVGPGAEAMLKKAIQTLLAS